MKRFHVHVSVSNLEESIRFYSALFGAQPALVKPDYAKWMLEDPRINFAISSRGAPPGVDHLGIQVGSDEELAQVRSQLEQAQLPVLDEPGAACCYALSDKHWVTDPQGIAWEAYRSLGTIPTFNDERAGATACCGPAATPVQVNFGKRGE
ncbi:ArsI/CadI family heavy metal resistance metalloenzyme [Pelomicrobium methylotrophicum]|uniref:Glyoxalase/bleomycin resistance/dioxygenase family protein n=1 Tax=Pelomicrobium methylotrophicum TaxID=2602750 RepID=A0A5C7ETJ6_9PROT|nr:ArsI/CadI family heavy metal resistance metalloenzyme [Pelomicrobium methylotrophicum]TXF10416.1 glyoxalase/bleomycin resistance/dioxygenase family protein [Pelomicrobium methylotrophicum]